MLFTSLQFAAFFALTLLLFYAAPAKGQRLVLLCANYVFYMWVKPVFGLLLLLGTLVTYLAARLTDVRALGLRRTWTALGAVCMLGQLALFKYADFFLSGLGFLFRWDNTPALGLLLPIGISFYSFAAAGYLFDVHRGKLAAERNFLTFAVFLSFFPSILSGPIPRARELLPQLRQHRTPDFPAMRQGLMRFVRGAAKKLVVSDALAVVVNTAYAAPESFTGGQWLFAVCIYSLYIYLDFSAYTDMAVGAGKTLGYTLPENFRAPYCARTVQDFWRRWHISLTSWFREYLFFPLGGSRCGRARTYLNILIVFAVSGLWHGAAVTFVVWGVLNGVYQLAGQYTAPARNRIRSRLGIREDALWLQLWQTAAVFALMTAAWIFFRAADMDQAVFIIKRILLIVRDGFGDQSLLAMGLSTRQMLVTAVFLLLCLAEDLRIHKGKALPCFENRPFLYCLTLAVLLAVIALFGAYGADFNQNEFVYFQF